MQERSIQQVANLIVMNLRNPVNIYFRTPFDVFGKKKKMLVLKHGINSKLVS